MPRRHWRDLAPAKEGSTAETDTAHRGVSAGSVLSGSALRGAAAPGTPLAALIDERQRLEQQFATLVGAAPADEGYSRRFPVASFAERRAEATAWARAREAASAAASRNQQPNSAPRVRTVPDPATGITDRTAAARSRLFQPFTSAVDRLDQAVEPVRRPLREVTGYADRLDDLDRSLAREGVSRAERDEFRRNVGGGVVDRVAGPLRRADEALERPRGLLGQVTSGVDAKVREMTTPMDRASSYARWRDERLGIDSGGSGDVFARRDAARERRAEGGRFDD